MPYLKWVGRTTVLVLLFSHLPTGAFAALPKAGASCSKAGATKTATNKKYTCIKSGKKLIWNKGVKISQPQPQPSGQPQPQPSGQPQPQPSGQPQPQPSGQPQPQPSSSATAAASTSKTSPVKEISSTYTTLATTTKIAPPVSFSAASGYLSAMGFASTTGTTLFDHPSGLASDGTNLLLVDRGNNRILVWNTAPTSSTSAPDFVLCQSSTTSTASGIGLNQCNWPSDAVVTSTGKLLVADSDNGRILVWNSMPTSTGQSASFAIDLGSDSWPWGVWSNGTKVIATLTGMAQIKIWNTFPSSGSQNADITITGDTINCLGTPRGVMSNGTAIITGDHNGKCAEHSVAHVFTSWPTSSSAAVSYDIVPENSNYAWPHGTFDSTTGKMYLLSKYLLEYDGVPSTSQAAKTAGTKIANLTPFEGGDGGDVEVVKGNLYVTEYNGNRLAVFLGIPTATSKASFYIGSPGLDSSKQNEAVNTLHTNYMITNPQVVVVGGSMAISSDFDRRIYVWKTIPASDGAKPDLVWTTQNQHDSNPLLAMDFQPDSSAGAIGYDGKAIYAAAGEKTFVIWQGIPTKTTDLPILNISNSIGSVTFSGALRVAVDSKYFYILDSDAEKIYVWIGLPASSSDSPDFSISAKLNRIRSDGTWLVGTSLYIKPHILIWAVATLKANVVTSGKVSGIQMNLPADALTSNGALFVADTSFHRVLVWNSVLEAMAGSQPDSFLGTTSSTEVRPAQSAVDMRWPASLWVAGGYLWVSERKFGHRVLRYSLT